MPLKKDLNTRIINEKQIYNAGLQRDSLNKILKHANRGPAYYREKIIISKTMSSALNKKILEFGSVAWSEWIDFKNSPPDSLTCINISETELQKGIDLAISLSLQDKISFNIMDAHKLSFPDDHFDCIYGSGILHHLDFKTALAEIKRVLRPGGFFLFHEPLRSNPVSNLFRFFTPKARTPDEKPLGNPELKLLKELFHTNNYYFQLFSVAASMLSIFIFKNPSNILTKTADRIDMLLLYLFPFLQSYHRYVLLNGFKTN